MLRMKCITREMAARSRRRWMKPPAMWAKRPTAHMTMRRMPMRASMVIWGDDCLRGAAGLQGVIRAVEAYWMGSVLRLVERARRR